MTTLSGAQVRHLKGIAQRLEPVLHLGKAGLSDEFIASANAALDQHELVKVRFANFKEEKKQLAPELADKTSSQLIQAGRQRCRLFPAESRPRETARRIIEIL
ncbi:MAG: YhbY family RNA-binding protein [Chthoniobacteraceae bacterium]